MAEQSGESANDASDTDNTSGTQCRPENPEGSAAPGDEAVGSTCQASARKTRGGEKQQAAAAGKSGSGSARAGAVQAVQVRVGGDRGADSERARYALRLPVLPEIAPRTRPGARL
jgi:hypothetical protein